MAVQYTIIPCFLILMLLIIHQFPCAQISMKIIDGQSMHGVQNNVDLGPTQANLKIRFQPSPFGGPSHLSSLIDECFDILDGEYNYVLCPFRNVTQFERSLRWNPYAGVLGTWNGWEIVNNTFKAMLFQDGDSCGAVFRSVRVIMKCGAQNRISKVSEPKTCQYQLEFETPLVCHNHSILVYPTLPEELRNRWNNIEGLLANEEITKQGYRKRLQQVFIDAGYSFGKRSKEKTVEDKPEEEKIHADEDNDDLTSLSKCATAYLKLRKENEGLRTLLRLNNHNKSNNGS